MPTGFDLAELLTPAGLADPYAVYARWRDDHANGADPGRLVFDADAASAVLTDATWSSDRVPSLLRRLPDRDRFASLEDTLRSITAFSDPPDHTRIRRVMARTFTPRAVSAMAPEVRAIAEREVRGYVEEGPGDVVERLTYPLPALVVSALLGIPEADRHRFGEWALAIVYLVGSGRAEEGHALEARAAMEEMHEYLGGLVAQRRRAPGDDLLSAMIASSDADAIEEDGTGAGGHGRRTGLSVVELHANALFLMVAGHETATNQLSNAIVTLCRHPAAAARVRDGACDPDRAVEELLRFEPAVQFTARIAREERFVQGQHLAAGQSIVVALGAANRDPARFADPDRLDIDREPGQHLTFARGAHHCLGAALARLELRTVVPTLLGAAPALHLADDEVAWQPTLDFRGPEELHLTW